MKLEPAARRLRPNRMIIRPLLPLLMLLSSCATVPSAMGPGDVQVPAEFVGQYRPPAGSQELWWKGFEDPALDRLVETALAENLSIEAARMRLLAAEAALRGERADRLPVIDGGASVAREVLGPGNSETNANAGIFASFDPDLSGRLSAEIQAAAASAIATEYLVADRRRLVATAVTQQYIQLRRSEARLALLDDSTGLQEQTLRIVRLRNEAGLAADFDVRRAASDLARTQAQRGLLELGRARSAHALAVLTGVSPGSLSLDRSGNGVPTFAGGPPRGIPANLLRRRPDLLVSEARLAEAAANIGVERADFLPSLVISGDLSGRDGPIGDLLSDVFGTIAAVLDLPLLDGGRRLAEIKAAEAEADARFADYRQSVLEVLADVENALAAIEGFSGRGTELAQAIEESDAAFGQSNALYREGLASLFDVLDVQRQLIASKELLIDARADLASSIVALYAAIGAPTDVEPK